MERRRLMLLVAVLTCMALLAGCGSSNNSSPSSSTSSTPSQASTQTKSPAGAPKAGEAVAYCKKIIQGETKLPANSKQKLESACVAASKGDKAAVKKVANEVCEEVVGKSNVLKGAAKEAELKACKK